MSRKPLEKELNNAEYEVLIDDNKHTLEQYANELINTVPLKIVTRQLCCTFLYYFAETQGVKIITKESYVIFKLTPENVVNLLSRIVKVSKDLKLGETLLKETCEGFRKPYSRTYATNIKLLYNSLMPFYKQDKNNNYIILIHL